MVLKGDECTFRMFYKTYSLRDAEGATFDRLFLEGMIKHHEGAIKMAQKVLDSKNVEVAALAAAIIDTQEKEIAFMQELIKFY